MAEYNLKPEIETLAEVTGDAERFLEDSVEAARQLSIIMRRFRNGYISLDEAIEDLESVAYLWESSFEELDE